MFHSSEFQNFRSQAYEGEIPVIDLDVYTMFPMGALSKLECLKVVKSLKTYGVLLVKDSRASQEHNSQFIDLMQRYFQLPQEVKLRDSRPQFQHRVGVVPGNIQVPVFSLNDKREEIISKLAPSSRPLAANSTDPKWRFSWKMGNPPKYPTFDLGEDSVIPEGFPEWSTYMNGWGTLMHNTLIVICEMLAIGLELPKNTFLDKIEFGSHVLSPSGANLEEFGTLDTVLTRFHHDLNFLTICGRSNFLGLNTWTSDGSKKISINIPPGLLLVHAGKQIETLTGGLILANYHEVVVNLQTLEAIQSARSEGRSLWSISSNYFIKVGSEVLLWPVEGLDSQQTPKPTRQFTGLRQFKTITPNGEQYSVGGFC